MDHFQVLRLGTITVNVKTIVLILRGIRNSPQWPVSSSWWQVCSRASTGQLPLDGALQEIESYICPFSHGHSCQYPACRQTFFRDREELSYLCVPSLVLQLWIPGLSYLPGQRTSWSPSKGWCCSQSTAVMQFLWLQKYHLEPQATILDWLAHLWVYNCSPRRHQQHLLSYQYPSSAVASPFDDMCSGSMTCPSLSAASCFHSLTGTHIDDHGLEVGEVFQQVSVMCEAADSEGMAWRKLADECTQASHTFWILNLPEATLNFVGCMLTEAGS